MNSSNFSAFCLAGTNSGCGKTIIATALIAALHRRGISVAPFKCGPDYIDPSYHSAAAGKNSVNLDTWIMNKKILVESFVRNSYDSEIAVVEGVMGLFDGASTSFLDGSTAGCAKLLNLPVILVVNASGISGSIAAIVYGFSKLLKGINIIGVIANKIGSENHIRLLADSLKAKHLPPLLGVLPKNPEFQIPERHLGLLPFAENKKQGEFFENLALYAEKYIDIDKILRISRRKRTSFKPILYPKPKYNAAILQDEAFTFYYPDNLHFLRLQGYNILKISPMRDKILPKNIDFLYIGGGFPEIFAKELSANCDFRKSVANFAKKGGIIYAECGGFMYLTEELRNSQGEKFPMCGVIAGFTKMNDKLQSLGYREVQTLHDMPFCKKGTVIRGHEFHWSSYHHTRNKLSPLFMCKNSRGEIFESGVRIQNVSASYIHLYFASIQ